MPTDSLTIADQSEAVLAAAKAHAPAHVVEALTGYRADLVAGGLPPGVIAVGSPLPDAELLDVNGSPITLAAARAGRPAVIVFYRGAWCPFCNVALKTYQAELVPALAARGFALLAVSPQKPDGSLTMQQKHDLTFAVLSDPANDLVRKLGILSAEMPDATRRATREIGVDINAANADGTDRLPMPTTIAVDAQGTIRWIDVRLDLAYRSEVPDILRAVDAVRG